MKSTMLAIAAVLASSALGGGAALSAVLDGATVNTTSFMAVTSPTPPSAVPTPSPEVPSPDCTVIHYCSNIDHQLKDGSFVSVPLPIVPVVYALDVLTLTYVTITDTTITLRNNYAGVFCFDSSCSGTFSGFGFYFSSGVNITNVTVDPSSALDFRPIDGGPTWTSTSIAVNLQGDNPAVGSTLILDINQESNPPPVPEPSTWAMMLLGFAGLGFGGYRRAVARLRSE